MENDWGGEKNNLLKVPFVFEFQVVILREQ